jgi:hypothetical protein
MSALVTPAYLYRSKIGGAPLAFEWGPNQYEFGHGFTGDGSQSAIVRKLVLMSVRATLGLLAASAEWLVFRLAGTDDPLLADVVAAVWIGAVDPRLVDLAALPYPEDKADPVKGPIREYLGTVRDCYHAAMDLDGAFYSYAETALRLVDYVMPNSAYRTWRRECFRLLAARTSSHAVRQVRVMLNERMTANGTTDDWTIIEQMLADGGLDELWGPALPRDAYDPKATPTAATSTDVLATFLNLTCVSSNPFLRKPN